MGPTQATAWCTPGKLRGHPVSQGFSTQCSRQLSRRLRLKISSVFPTRVKQYGADTGREGMPWTDDESEKTQFFRRMFLASCFLSTVGKQSQRPERKLRVSACGFRPSTDLEPEMVICCAHSQQ